MGGIHSNIGGAASASACVTRSQHLSARMCQARCLIVIFTGNMLRSPRKPLHSSLPETASVSSNGRNSENQLGRNSENQRMEQLKCHFWWSRRSCFIDCVGNHGHQRPHHPYRARDCAVRIAWSTREFLARTPRLFDLQGFKPSARGCQSLLDDLQHRCSSLNLHSRLSYLHHLAASYVQTIDRLP